MVVSRVVIPKVKRDAFFKTIGYTPHKQQLLYHDSDARFRFANCGRRFGKALYIGTPIFTPNGWTTMGELKYGDVVFDENGKPCTVTGTTVVQFDRPCYKVTFADGSEIIADEQHEWLTWDKPARKAINDTRRHTKPAIRTTLEISNTVMAGKERNHGIRNVVLGLDLPDAKLEIDPYVLGCWLGDGTSASGQITSADPEMLDEIASRGYEITKNKAKYRYGILGLNVQLRKNHLLYHKHVPNEYLMASRSQRLDLLQGLMDTDGTVGNNGQCEFNNMDKALADAVEWLAVSLGATVVRATKAAKLDGQYLGMCERVHITAMFPLFKLDRKLVKQFAKNISSSRMYRFIKSVELVESVPVKCIEVDSESHLYLAGLSLIPTHNSTMAAKDLEPKLFVPDRRYWIVAPTYDLGEKEFRIIWQDLIVNMKLGQQNDIRKAYNKKQGSMFIEFTKWNTSLEVRTALHPENLVGETLDHVIMSEAAKHDQETWQRYIRPALADKRGGADFPTTPEGFNWLYDEWMHGQDDAYPEYASWKFPTWANSEIFPEGENDPEIVAIKRDMTPESFNQEIAADFGSFVGKIYPEWDVTEHVGNFGYNPAWPNYMAVDFGYTNPLAAIEFQISPDDQIYIWREHYRSHTTLDQHIDLMKNREQPTGYNINLVFGDAADPEGIASLSEKFAPSMGMPEAKVNWRQGIDLVRSFLKGREIGQDETGMPLYRAGLHVSHNCPNLIREFNNYKSPGSVNGKNVTEMGIKADDHALDALRYGLVHIYVLGALYGLSEVMDLNRSFETAGNTYSSMAANSGSSLFGNSSGDGYFTTVGSF